MSFLGDLFGKSDKNTYHGNDERKNALALLEDKRLAFAKTELSDFKPVRALFATTPEGGFTGVAESGNELYVIEGPGPYEDGRGFFCERAQKGFSLVSQDVSVPAEGAGGVLGFGRQAQTGHEYRITCPSGHETRLFCVKGRNSILTVPGMKCRLGSIGRFRGNANFAFDMRPIEKKDLTRQDAILRGMILKHL